MTSQITSENDWNKSSSNNGYLRTSQNPSTKNILLTNKKSSQNKLNQGDDVTGALLADTPLTQKTTTTNGPQSQPPQSSSSPNPSQSSATKTAIVHFDFGPGQVTTTSIEPKCIYRDSKLRRRLIILVLGSALLGAAIGILSLYFAKFNIGSTG